MYGVLELVLEKCVPREPKATLVRRLFSLRRGLILHS